MATYSAPTAAEIRAYTGLKATMFDPLPADFDGDLTARIEDGEDDVFLRIGESFRDNSSLTAAQVRVLQRAVALRTGATFILRLITERVTGDYAPHIAEDSDAFRDVLQDFEVRAKVAEALLQREGADAARNPFVRPAFGSGTFSVTGGDRSPADRNALQDERDNISAWNTEAG